MKKLLLWLCGILLALLLVCVVLLIFKDPLLGAFMIARVEKETGAKASLGSFKLDLTSGYVHIKDFKLHNPPGFDDSLLLRVPELFLRVDRDAAGKDTFRLDEARVNLAELNIIRNAAGQTNIFELEEHSRSKRKKKAKDRLDDISFGGIGELHVSVGTVRYRDMRNATNNYEFVIGIENEVVTTIKNEKDLETWAKAFLVRITVQQLVKQAQEGRLKELLKTGRRP